MKVFIHAGAHKTATTYIQDTLESNEDILKENKISYLTRANLRPHLQEAVRGSGGSFEKIENTIKREIDLEYDIIISEENLAGILQMFHI